MLGGLSVTEYAPGIFSLINYTHDRLYPCGIPVLRRPISVTAPRRKKRIAVQNALKDGGGSGGIVVDNLEFKPSFDEYLKALESVKIDRVNNNSSNSSSSSSSSSKTSYSDNSPRKKKEEKRRNDEVNFSSRKGDFSKRSEFSRDDSRRGDFRKEMDREKFNDRKSNGEVNVYSRKVDVSRRSESRNSDMERAAFKLLECDDDVMDKPRVTKADMEERIQRLAKCLNGADINIPEWKFSETMRSAQIRFSDHSILRVIQILGNLGNWRRVLQVIEWIQSRERYKSHKIRYIYTAALDALGKARRPVEALNLFRRMQDQMASYPDKAAYHCIAVTLGQAGYMKELFDVIDTMKSPPKKKFKSDLLEKWDPRLEPDVIVYNAVLNACVRRKKWEGAFWVLQQLNEKGQQPTSTTYGLVMEVMLACGQYNLVHDFFKKVQKSYIPNALIYKVLVNALWREGKIDEAIMAVDEMEGRGIVGNAALYYDLARCLCSAGRCHEALKQIDKICKVANKPLVVTYTGLIQACLESGDTENAAYIFNHMLKFCHPNLVTYNIMLKGFLDHGKFEEAKQLFLTLLENSSYISREEDYKVRVIPDIYTFNTMLDACAVENKWDDLEFVYTQMLKFGHHFNAKRHLRLVLDARRAGKDSLLELTWKRLQETERPPPPPLVTEMFATRLEHGDHAAALSYIVNFTCLDSQVFSRKTWSKFFAENGGRFPGQVLEELVREGSVLLRRSETPALEHLIESCKGFLRTNSDMKRVGSMPQNEAAFVC